MATAIPQQAQAEDAAAAQSLIDNGGKGTMEMEAPVQKETGFLAKLKQPHIRDTIIWSAVALIVSLLYIFAFPCQPLTPKNKALNATITEAEWNATTIPPHKMNTTHHLGGDGYSTIP